MPNLFALSTHPTNLDMAKQILVVKHQHMRCDALQYDVIQFEPVPAHAFTLGSDPNHFLCIRMCCTWLPKSIKVDEVLRFGLHSTSIFVVYLDH